MKSARTWWRFRLGLGNERRVRQAIVVGIIVAIAVQPRWGRGLRQSFVSLGSNPIDIDESGKLEARICSPLEIPQQMRESRRQHYDQLLPQKRSLRVFTRESSAHFLDVGDGQLPDAA